MFALAAVIVAAAVAAALVFVAVDDFRDGEYCLAAGAAFSAVFVLAVIAVAVAVA